jgi:NAD(P)-dependent dehydrogenase (short-subunit alcohol dehydrogenase family)
MVSEVPAKVAIVTGASEGIGAATARRLRRDGLHQVLVARREEPGRRLVEQLGADRAVFVAGDVADPATGRRAVEAALERFGRLDVLVNNAGVDYTSDLLETPLEDVRGVFEINVFGAFLLLQEAARAMRTQGGGAIVNVTSRLASIGVPTMVVYSAAKGALLALTRGAAIELAPLGIRVNAVAPGFTETPLVTAWLAEQEEPDAARRSAMAAVPQGRLGTPDEIAAAIAFLASDDAGHITGASLAVDGGYTAA